MTTSRWLWLGFGCLTALLVAILASMLAQWQSVQQDVETMANVERIRNTTALELEVSVLAFALDVRTYLQNDAAAARQGAASDAADVRQFLASYQRLADTERQRNLAMRFDALWRQLEALGRRLLEAPARTPDDADLSRFYELRRQLESLLGDEIQSDAAASYELRKISALAELRGSQALSALLLVLGTLIAVATSVLVGRRILVSERQLQSNAEQQAVTLASIGDAVISTDLDGRVVSLNPVAQSLTGWSQAEAAGVSLDNVFRIVHESSRAPAENPARRALQDGRVVGLANHTLLIAKDGTEHPIDDSAAPIRDRAGRMVGVVLVFRDISARRRHEQTLQGSERRLRELIDLLPGAIYTTDSAGRLLDFNPAAVKFSGQLPELGSDSWFRQWTLYRSDGTPLAHEHYPMTRVLESGHAARGDELVLQRKDGTHLWFALYQAPRFDAAGRPAGALNLLLDITERNEGHTALKLSELRYKRLFESAKDGILVLDAASARITDANPFICDLLGYQRAELVGRELWQIGLFQDRTANLAVMRTLQKQRYLRYEDLPLQTRSGERIDVEFVSNVYGLAPNLVIQCSIRDIGERKRATEALLESNRRKNEFLAMLAHELRNPLAPIRNALEIIRRAGTDTGLLHSATETMDRQVAHMVRLVDDLLDMSRIDRGTIELRRSRVELGAVVRQAAEVARPLCDQLRHRLSVSLPAGPIYLDADPTRLTQVLGNLLNNACKFTPPGGHVELLIERQPGLAVIRVRDNGVGIAEDHLARVFEMFVQVDSSLERSAGGLGIGLTLVKTLVELHGGTVQAASAGAGLGSEFVIRLPLSAAVDTLPAPPVRSGLQRADVPARRILVVDDNRDASESLAQLLRLSGHHTRVVHDGVEALAAAQDFDPQIVLLDIGLPRLSGYEVARRLRRQPGGDRIVLVALTGWGQDEDRERSRAAGFDAHLVKPVDPAQLTEVLTPLNAVG